MTLLQSISDLIDNITVTDRQEENIQSSLSNLESHLKNKDNDLHVDKTLTTGSYERDTIIRPLSDVDMFAVLNREKWQDDSGKLPSPQSVLTKMKNYLNGLNDYKDKVSQDRPCVTIKLSNKNFDVLPSFEEAGGGYLIPNYDLQSWTYSYPEQLATDMDSVHKLRNYKVKQTVKAIKYWNREHDKYIPSYHVEEVAISIFQVYSFINYEESIRIWFNKAEYYFSSAKFRSSDQYQTTINRIKKVKDDLNDAKKKYDNGEEVKARQIWKEIFGKEFPTVDEEEEEAKSFSKSFSEGTLKISPSGFLSKTAGSAIAASGGHFGDE